MSGCGHATTQELEAQGVVGKESRMTNDEVRGKRPMGRIEGEGGQDG